MKKLMLVLIAVISFAASASALSFRATQSLCWENEQIILRTDGTFTLYDDGVKMISGTYTIDRSTGRNVVELYPLGDEDKAIRCTFRYIPNSLNVAALTFRGYEYRACSR